VAVASDVTPSAARVAAWWKRLGFRRRGGSGIRAEGREAQRKKIEA
jgi:hypothetical protein